MNEQAFEQYMAENYWSSESLQELDDWYKDEHDYNPDEGYCPTCGSYNYRLMESEDEYGDIDVYEVCLTCGDFWEVE